MNGTAVRRYLDLTDPLRRAHDTEMVAWNRVETLRKQLVEATDAWRKAAARVEELERRES